MFNAWWLSRLLPVSKSIRFGYEKNRKGFGFSPWRTGPIVLLISKRGERFPRYIYICVCVYFASAYYTLSTFLCRSLSIYIYLLPLPSVADPIRASSFKSVVLVARYQLRFSRGFSPPKKPKRVSPFCLLRRKKKQVLFSWKFEESRKKKVSRSLEGKDFGNLVAPLFVKIRGRSKKKRFHDLWRGRILEILSLLFSWKFEEGQKKKRFHDFWRGRILEILSLLFS